MTDNGACYTAHAYDAALQRARPSPPSDQASPATHQRQGRRFIQTLLNEWAYNRVYGSSEERLKALPLFLRRYNFRRPHGSLGKQTPASRLNNVVRNYI